MKKIIALAVFVLVFCGAYLAQSVDPPKVPIEDRAALLDLEKQSLQIFIQSQQLEKKYEDALKNDPAYADLQRQSSDISKKLSDKLDEVQKKIDPTKEHWILDPQTLDPKSCPGFSGCKETTPVKK